MDEIDSLRLSKVRVQYPEISAADVYTHLFRTSQTTLYQLFRHSRKPLESEVITASACLYVRFFHKHSLIDFKPRAVLVACVNLAVKTEEYHSVSLSDLVSALPDAAELKQVVPRIEMKLLASTGFDLVFQQPWPIMLYWVDELKRDSPDDGAIFTQLYDNACDIVRVWQWTDAVLLFSMPHLATCAVLKACINSAKADDRDDTINKFRDLCTKVLPSGVDLTSILRDIEQVVTRFGSPEEVLKDPAREQTEGYRRLIEVVGSSR